jgi:hypothetical protein
MQTVTTIGLDIAKSVFQIHGIDAAGDVIVRRKLKRRYVLPFFQKLPPCVVGIEACASSHHWSRELQALGHTRVRRVPQWKSRQQFLSSCGNSCQALVREASHIIADQADRARIRRLRSAKEV